MSKANVFFIGPQKAGTSWVDAYLRWHGGVNLPANVKETMYFDKFYDQGSEWYEALYDTDHPGPRVEVAPTYFTSRAARERIREFDPRARFVVSVREPVARTWSSYRHEKRYGFIAANRTFRQAVEEHHLERASRYNEHVQQWTKAFSPEQIDLLFLSDMRDLDAYARRICELVGVPFRPVPDELRARVNEADTPRNYQLAALVSKLNRFSRRMGLFRFRRFLIDLGLKRLIYAGGRETDEVLADEDKNWLMQHYLRDDWEQFQQYCKQRGHER